MKGARNEPDDRNGRGGRGGSREPPRRAAMDGKDLQRRVGRRARADRDLRARHGRGARNRGGWRSRDDRTSREVCRGCPARLGRDAVHGSSCRGTPRGRADGTPSARAHPLAHPRVGRYPSQGGSRDHGLDRPARHGGCARLPAARPRAAVDDAWADEHREADSDRRRRRAHALELPLRARHALGRARPRARQRRHPEAGRNTPVTGGVVIARLFEEAELPEGVLHVLPGDGEVGHALVADPNVRMISFTGSTATGHLVGETAGRMLKRLVLEMGGNSPLVVLEDADIEAASSAGAWGSFLHQGQICLSVSRHLVHESIVDEYTEALVERAGHLPVGNPATEQVALGPIINERQLARVRRIVDESVEQGAKVLAGGTNDGLFFAATVLGGVTPAMPAFAEEIFGPVAPVTSFRDDAEAVELANATAYGLSAAVQSGSP